MRQLDSKLDLNSPTFADKCFDYENVTDELFDVVHEILGGQPISECTKPEFKFHVINTWVDPYDSSVEVILPSDVPPMTREQADKILALGFGLVFESQGERGTVWSENRSGQCSTRTSDDERHREKKLRVELEQMRKDKELLGKASSIQFHLHMQSLDVLATVLRECNLDQWPHICELVTKTLRQNHVDQATRDALRQAALPQPGTALEVLKTVRI